MKWHRELIRLLAALLAVPVVAFVIAQRLLLSGLNSYDDVDAVTFIKSTAVIAAVVGIGLVAMLALAGRISRSNRSSLLLIFRPGLYLTIVVLSVLIFLHAALAIGAIYYAEATWGSGIHIGILFAIGFGAVVGTVSMIGSAFSVVSKATTTVVGKMKDLRNEPELQQFVAELAGKVGTPIPENVVVGLIPNFPSRKRMCDALMAF